MKNPKGVYAKGTRDFGGNTDTPEICPTYKKVDAKNLGSATKGRALSSGHVRAMRKNGTKNRLISAEGAMKKVRGTTGPNKY